jgi:exosortase F-associated protein
MATRKTQIIRVTSIGTGVLGLAMVYIFQRDFFYSGFSDFGAGTVKLPDFDAFRFAWHKLIRFLLNDGFSLLIIYGIFQRKDFMSFGFKLFQIELFVILPIYLTLSVFLYEPTRFFLQHIHRLVVNPVLMMLLIPAFFYQQHLEKDQSSSS